MLSLVLFYYSIQFFKWFSKTYFPRGNTDEKVDRLTPVYSVFFCEIMRKLTLNIVSLSFFLSRRL